MAIVRANDLRNTSLRAWPRGDPLHALQRHRFLRASPVRRASHRVGAGHYHGSCLVATPQPASARLHGERGTVRRPAVQTPLRLSASALIS
eukprot:2621162-Prymnesium_polylepis.1